MILVAAAREHDRDVRPGGAAGARARHPAARSTSTRRRCRDSLVRRRRARGRDTSVRVARRPLHAHADPRRRPRSCGRSFMALTGAVSSAVADGASRAPGAGFGASARIPISPSLIADQYPIGVRTRMFATENLGRPAGLVVGPFFVGAVAGWAGGRRRLAVGDGRGRDPRALRRARARCSSASRRGAATSRKPSSVALLDDSRRPAGATERGGGPPAQGARASATSSSASACSGSRW